MRQNTGRGTRLWGRAEEASPDGHMLFRGQKSSSETWWAFVLVSRFLFVCFLHIAKEKGDKTLELPTSESQLS